MIFGNTNEDNSMRVIFADMPTKVHEMLMVDAEGFYTIMINCRDSIEDRWNHYRHAVSHILGSDFEKEEADRIEKECHARRQKELKQIKQQCEWHGEIYETD